MLQLGLGLFRGGEGHQFDLVELVLADDALGVLAVGAGLAAEAGGEGAVAQGQLVAGDDLVAVQVGHRHLGGGDEVQGRFPVRNLEQVRLELGQLAGTVEAVGVDQVGRQHLAPAGGGLPVEHEGDQRPFELRPLAPQHREAGAAELGRPIQVEDAKPGCQVHMVLRLLDGPRLAPALDLDVAVLVAARRDAVVGHVGDRREEVPEGPLGLAFGGLQGLQGLADLLLGLDQGAGVLLLALEPADLLADPVALGLEHLRFLDDPAPFRVEPAEALPVEGEAALRQAGDDGLEVGSEQDGIEHGGPFRLPV